MSHIKIASPSGWDMDGPQVAMLKIASGGLKGRDLADFVKRASGSENIFLPYLNDVKFAAGEIPTHHIAMGSTEFWGCNRNADGFKEAMLRECHPSFVKHARIYRGHRNKDKAKSYGVIKCSVYNEKMHRVELLAALNGTKEAAERNGGLVADKELEKLASGDDLPGSMALRVPYDVCSACNNKARTRDEYCKAATCKGGGCTDNLGKIVKIAGHPHLMHVDNPSGTFFDYSHVGRPADRTAYGALADYVEKAAEDLGFFGIGGAKTAEELGIVVPRDVLEETGGQLVKLALGLDIVDRLVNYDLPLEANTAFGSHIQPDVDFAELGLDRPEKIASGLAALADQKIILPLRDFARMTKRAGLAEQTNLRHVYGRMIDDGSLERRIESSPYAMSGRPIETSQKAAAVKLARSHGLTLEAVSERSMLAALRGASVKNAFCKIANMTAESEVLARDYAIYRLSALERIAETDGDFPLTARLSALQNQNI